MYSRMRGRQVRSEDRRWGWGKLGTGGGGGIGLDWMGLHLKGGSWCVGR